MGNGQRIAFCGLDCWECPARIATVKDDWFARCELAAQWTTRDYPVMAEDINCEGCNTGEPLIFIYCKECEIRRCGIKHGIVTCAECGEYPCELIKRAPTEVRNRLKELAGF